MTTILTKIKYKVILFENIQGFVSNRHYILPYIINNDKILEKQLKIFNGLLKDNKLSSKFINNLFTFISDRILFRVVNKEKDLMDDNQYIPEEGENNKFQIIKKRILNIYKSGKYHKETNINIKDLEQYLPNDKEFALFIFDFLENKSELLSVFPNLKGMNNFLSYYENNKNLFENKDKINQISSNDTEIIYNNMNRKVLINVAFIGNKNSGKSTTIGHLLLSTGYISQNEFIKTKNYANDYGVSSYKFSWLVDNIWGERTYKKTIIYHIKKFETKKYDFNLIDLPGDFHLRKNIIKGLSLADAAVIVVTAENENSENDDHIKDYLIIIYSRGIRQLIIAINKMDQTKDMTYFEKNFIKIKKNMLNLCKNIGYNIDSIQFIAYSGYTGQNLVNKHEDEDTFEINKMQWYKGKTLLESLDEIKPPKRDFDGPLKISVFNTEKITGIGTVVEGKILSGKLKTNTKLCFPFENKEIKECKSIEIHNIPVYEAIAGDIIGFNIKGISIEFIRYNIINLVFEDNEMNYLKKAENLRVKIFMINKKATLKVGSAFHFFCYTLNAPIKVAKIEYLTDETNKILEKEPKEIKNGGYAIIIIKFYVRARHKVERICNKMECYDKTIKRYFFEKYIENPFLGSFELFNNHNLIAVGNIKDINVL